MTVGNPYESICIFCHCAGLLALTVYTHGYLEQKFKTEAVSGWTSPLYRNLRFMFSF